MLSISLGFSCQTRMTIDEVSADHRRMPFDNLITTRAAVLEALRSDGATLWPAVEALQVYTMPREGREGPHVDGLYFWHDYPMEGAKLAPGWRGRHADICAKYSMLWARFAKLMRDPATPKRLLISNTQANLAEFATPETFAGRFGLTTDYWSALVEALEGFGARNFEVLFLNRGVADVAQARAHIADPRLTTRFGGILALPTNTRLAASALGPQTFDGSRIERICGRYEGGWTLVRSIGPTAIAYRDVDAEMTPMGEFCEADGGFLAFISSVPNYAFRVIQDGDTLRLTNPAGGAKPVWRRMA